MGIDSKLATLAQRKRPSQNSNVRDIIGHTLPCIYRVPALETQILTTATGPLVKYKWNKALFVVGVQLMTRSTADAGATWVFGSEADLRGVDLAWGNECHEQIATSGSIPSSFPGAACSEFNKADGFFPNWAQLDMQVRAHDVWTFQVTNNTLLTVVPYLAFQCIEDFT